MIALLVVLAIAATPTPEPINLTAMIQIESAGDPRAVSPAGALGLLQIMPATWREWAKPGERWYNREDSIRVASRYLRWISRTLRKWGDPGWWRASHVLAAYNGGIGHFRSHRWRISRMRLETRRHVRRYAGKAR